MQPGLIKNFRSNRGQSLTEFAFGAMAMIILIAGIVDLGSMFFTYMALRDAAQEGAAYGSLNPKKTPVENRVKAITNTPIDLDNTQVTTDFYDPDTGLFNAPACEGNQIIVTVAYDYTIHTPFLGTIIGTQNIHLETTMKNIILRPKCD